MSYFRLFTFVPEKHTYIVERLGKFSRQLEPGLNWLVPFLDTVAYKQSLKEEAIKIENQTAITQDNVSLHMDGVLFIRIFDPLKASYQVEQPLEAAKFLAVTLMRSEVGKLRLDKLFQEREELNRAINEGVNSAAEAWGISCLRYEILNIDPPDDIKRSMQAEAEAERLKRRDILLSEAKKIAEINVSTGKNKSAILLAEAEAESIQVLSEKEKEAIDMIAKSISNGNSNQVIDYILAQNYLRDYGKTLKKGNVTVAPNTIGKGGSGTGAGNNDFTSLAAMLLANQTRQSFGSGGAGVERENIQASNGGRGNTSYELFDELTRDDYNTLSKKIRSADNAALYSSDEEALRRASDAKQQQTDQPQGFGKL